MHTKSIILFTILMIGLQGLFGQNIFDPGIDLKKIEFNNIPFEGIIGKNLDTVTNKINSRFQNGDKYQILRFDDFNISVDNNGNYKIMFIQMNAESKIQANGHNFTSSSTIEEVEEIFPYGKRLMDDGSSFFQFELSISTTYFLPQSLLFHWDNGRLQQLAFHTSC